MTGAFRLVPSLGFLVFVSLAVLSHPSQAQAESLEDIMRGFAEVYLKEATELKARKAKTEEYETTFIKLYNHMGRRLKAIGVEAPTVEQAGKLLYGHLLVGDQLLVWRQLETGRPEVLWGWIEQPFLRFNFRHPKRSGSKDFLELLLLEEETSIPLRERSVTLGDGLILHRLKAWREVADHLREICRKIDQAELSVAPDRATYPAWLALKARYQQRRGDDEFRDEVLRLLLRIARWHERCHAADMLILEPLIFESYPSNPVAYRYLEVRGWLAALSQLESDEEVGIFWWFLVHDLPEDERAREVAGRVFSRVALAGRLIERAEEGKVVPPWLMRRLFATPVRRQTEWAKAALTQVEKEASEVVKRLSVKK